MNDNIDGPSREGPKGRRLLTLAGSLTLAFLGVAPGITQGSAQAQSLLSAKFGDASAASVLFNYVAFEQTAAQNGEAQQKAQPAASGGSLDLFSYVAGEQQAAAERPIRVAEAKAKDAKPASAPAAAAASSKAKMVKPAPDDPEGRYYVGSEPCKVCHAAWIEEFKLTVMGRMFKTGKDTKQGEPIECETCHGPASAHVNGGGGRLGGNIRSFRKADPRTSVADTNGVCLGCHENGDRTYWKASTHATRDVACTDCHTVMKKMTPRYQLAKGNVMDTCFQCHKDRRAQMLRNAHMPQIEGKISCTSCHNPHGTAAESGLLKEATVNDTCYQCHADKRGPFLWEHPPVRENCLNCHEPHGSMHNSLLVVARQRLCQRCHAGVPHGQAGLSDNTGGNMRRLVGLACQNCHTNIHGSNAPNGSRWHR
jgi:DmsE family decaheme c-type cytochrome